MKHAELLDAAHIIPDSEPEGDPVVPNGIALCKLHHAAYDRHILGIRPDYVVEIREDILNEIDGPMLQHGIKELHEQRILVPRDNELKPNPVLLDGDSGVSERRVDSLYSMEKPRCSESISENIGG